MFSSVRASSSAASMARRAMVRSVAQTQGRRMFSASTIQRAAASSSSSTPPPKSGSSWLTITALTALAATSGYYLFSPVDGKALVGQRIFLFYNPEILIRNTTICGSICITGTDA